MSPGEGKPLAAQRVLLAVARPLLRRGLLDWLHERYPDLALDAVADPVALRERLPLLRPQLLLAEPELLARAGLLAFVSGSAEFRYLNWPMLAALLAPLLLAFGAPRAEDTTSR